MMRRWFLVLAACAALLVGGCQQVPNMVVSDPVDTSKIEQSKLTPEAGKTVVVGRVRSSQQQRQALADTRVWLATVHRQGDQAAFAVDGARSPSTATDSDGTFVFSNVNPFEYVVVVGDLYGKNVIVLEPNGDAKVWPTKAGSVINVGEIFVDLP